MVHGWPQRIPGLCVWREPRAVVIGTDVIAHAFSDQQLAGVHDHHPVEAQPQPLGLQEAADMRGHLAVGVPRGPPAWVHMHVGQLGYASIEPMPACADMQHDGMVTASKAPHVDYGVTYGIVALVDWYAEQHGGHGLFYLRTAVKSICEVCEEVSYVLISVAQQLSQFSVIVRARLIC